MFFALRIVSPARLRFLPEVSRLLVARVFSTLRYVAFARADVCDKHHSSAKHTNSLVECVEEPTPAYSIDNDVSFTFAVVALSAKVAQADGEVSKLEYLAFRDAFPLTGGICGKIRQLFALSCRSDVPYSEHVNTIKTAFPENRELFLSLVERLFLIAAADKPITRPEEVLLARISRQFGLTPAQYSDFYEKYSRPPAPHVVLGVGRRSPRNIIKERYRALMRRYHPDLFASMKVSPELGLLLTLKTSQISSAYNKMTRNV